MCGDLTTACSSISTTVLSPELENHVRTRPRVKQPEGGRAVPATGRSGEAAQVIFPQALGKAPGAPAHHSCRLGAHLSQGPGGRQKGREGKGSDSGDHCRCPPVRNGTSFSRRAATTSRVQKLCLSCMPLWQAPFFWSHLRSFGHLLALQVLAWPCPTSSREAAAFPSSP